MKIPADIIEKIVKYLPAKDQLNFALAAAESKTEESIGFSAVEIIRQVAKEQLSIPIDNLRAYRLIKSNNPHLWDGFVLEKIESDPFNLENVLSKILFLHGLHPENTCPLPTPHDLIPDIFYPELLKLFSRQWTQSEREIFLSDRFAHVSPSLFRPSYDQDKLKALLKDILLVIQPEDSHEVLFRQAYDALKENRTNSGPICAAAVTICHLVHRMNNDECKKIWELIPEMLRSTWGAEFFKAAEMVTALVNANKVNQNIVNEIKSILMAKFTHCIVAQTMSALVKQMGRDESDVFFIELENSLLKPHTDEYASAAFILLSKFPERMHPARCLRLFGMLQKIFAGNFYSRTEVRVTALALIESCAITWEKEQLDILLPIIRANLNCGMSDLMEQAYKTLFACFPDSDFKSPIPVFNKAYLKSFFKFTMQNAMQIESREEVRAYLLMFSPAQRELALELMKPYLSTPSCAALFIPVAIYLQHEDIQTLAKHSPNAAKIIRLIKHHHENANLRISAQLPTHSSMRYDLF